MIKFDKINNIPIFIEPTTVQIPIVEKISPKQTISAWIATANII